MGIVHALGQCFVCFIMIIEPLLLFFIFLTALLGFILTL